VCAASAVWICLLTSCRPAGVLDPHGPVSSAERLILMNATVIMLVVVVPVILLTLVFAWWYRASNRRAVYKPDWAYSGQIELVVWAIPEDKTQVRCGAPSHPSGVAGLEVAVHLSGSRRGCSQ
jgi:heme/copper-type cytochrome/quinol oxidase subunit 2